MIKRLIAALLAFFAAISVFAADANTANQADLEAVKGIGPAIASKIIAERKNGNFKDWPDLVTRVKGIGDKSAAKLSAAGLTVNGAAMSGAPAAPAAPAATKPAMPAPAPAPAAKPATTAAPAAPAAPAASSAKELKKAAAAKAKADKASAAAQKKADKAAAKAAAASAAAAARKK